MKVVVRRLRVPALLPISVVHMYTFDSSVGDNNSLLHGHFHVYW